MEFTYKYNKDGLLIEEDEIRDIKVNGSDSKSKTRYTDYKLDSYGNWTQRKRTEDSKVEGIPQYNIPKAEYTFVNIEYRTITYYPNPK